jgi:hypothetical protein
MSNDLINVILKKNSFTFTFEYHSRLEEGELFPFFGGMLTFYAKRV